MTRSLAWLGLSLGGSLLLAVSCSSSDAKKAAHLTPASAGDTAGGAADGNASGSGNDSSAAPMPGSAGVGGDAAGGAFAAEMTDGWLSGTRLRAVLDVSGSAKLFKQWHDAMLDIDCNFAVDENGVERCLPSSDYAYGLYADT